MIKNMVLSFVGGVVLTVAASAAYLYFYPTAPAAANIQNAPEGTVLAVPDDSVLTAPVSAVSATSISLTKQNGTTATFSLSSTTPVILAATEPGKPGVPKTIGDIKVGAVVMVQADKADASVAALVLILPPIPAQ
jgi:hypothetical protein